MNYLTLFLLFCAICAKSDDGFWWSLPSSIIVNPYNVNDYFDYSNFTAGTVSPSLTQMTNSVFPIPTNDFTGPSYNAGPPNLPVYDDQRTSMYLLVQISRLLAMDIMVIPFSVTRLQSAYGGQIITGMMVKS